MGIQNLICSYTLTTQGSGMKPPKGHSALLIEEAK